jgi:hypothetical protein
MMPAPHRERALPNPEGHGERRVLSLIFVGVWVMFKKLVRVGFVSVVLVVVLFVLLLALAVVACVVLDDASRDVLCEKTLDGILGGVMFGLLSGLRKWYRVRDRAGFTLWRFRCVIGREVKTGFCSGMLVGLVCGVLMLVR